MKLGPASFVLLAALAPAAANADTILYSNDFQSGPLGPEWSTNSVLTDAPTFTRFNGRYSTGYTELTLAYPALPASIISAPPSVPPPNHEKDLYRFTLTFDFYAIDTWDGDASHVNFHGHSVGPDRFNVVVNNATLFSETFSNRSYAQSYRAPDQGRFNMGFESFEDAIYRQITLAFTPTTTDPIVIRWQDMGLGATGLIDESWGIDNINVSYTPVPAPASLALIGAGLLCFRRRR